MSQFESTHNQIAKVLQQILGMIAEDASLSHCVPTILQYSQEMSRASAGFVIVFDQPHYLYASPDLNLPELSELLALAAQLELSYEAVEAMPEAFAAKFKQALFLPIYQEAQVVGMLGLLYSEPVQPGQIDPDVLASILHSLRIVVNAEISEFKHTRNVRHQNEFVRVTTHDLRSPLTVLKGVGGMLEANMLGTLEPHQMGLVEKILTGVNQMEALVDNIQDAGRFDPETGFYELDRSPSDLNDIVQRIVQRQLVPAEKQELTLVMLQPEDVPILNVDSNMIERAIINLVDNAIKYTPNGGLIEIGIKVADEQVLISVSDNGYGISSEDAKRLFQRHFRIRRREHARVKGSGLGLFIVRSVAFHHDGEAWVQSVEGQGSTFYMSIPLKGENLLI